MRTSLVGSVSLFERLLRSRPPLNASTVRPVKTRAWFTVIVSAVTAASVWALSPLLVGHREPWDTDGIFYIVALAVVGSLAGLIVPRPLWAHYLGAIVGQLGYVALFLPLGTLSILDAATALAVTLGFLLGYSLIFLAAAALAAFVRTRLSSRSAHV
jgi:hypothetical protein